MTSLTLCTPDQLSFGAKSQIPKPSDVEWAIAQLTDDTEGLHLNRKDKAWGTAAWVCWCAVCQWWWLWAQYHCQTLDCRGWYYHLWVNHQGDYHSSSEKWSNNMLTRWWEMESLHHCMRLLAGGSWSSWQRGNSLNLPLPMLFINFMLCLLGYAMHQEHFNVWWNMSCKAFTCLHPLSTLLFLAQHTRLDLLMCSQGCDKLD